MEKETTEEGLVPTQTSTSRNERLCTESERENSASSAGREKEREALAFFCRLLFFFFVHFFVRVFFFFQFFSLFSHTNSVTLSHSLNHS